MFNFKKYYNKKYFQISLYAVATALSVLVLGLLI